METIESGPSPVKNEERNKILSADILKEIQNDYEKGMKDDKTARNPLAHTEFDDLIPEVSILYEKMKTPEDALTSLALAQEKIEQLKKKKDKRLSSNEEFIGWIDDQIKEKASTKELEDEKAKG